MVQDPEDGQRWDHCFDGWYVSYSEALPYLYQTISVLTALAVMSPLASSMFTPGIKQIAEDLDTKITTVVGATTGYVVMLGVGPLILAPLSETFGRRMLYLICFSIFTLLQIPTALTPNVETLIVVRTISGFFGSTPVSAIFDSLPIRS